MLTVALILLGALPVAAALGLYIGSWYLRRAVRELQYGLADLEDRLVREVKRRAGKARWEPSEESDPLDAELAKALANKPAMTRGEFIRRKWEGIHGAQNRKVSDEGG